MRIRFSPRAAEDLENVYNYIAKDSENSAWMVASAIRHSIGRLVQWPHSARATDIPGVRRLVISNYPYVVYYEVKDDSIVILTVLHVARDT